MGAKSKSTRQSNLRIVSGFEIEKNLRNFNSFLSFELAKVIGVIMGELDYAIDVEENRLKNQSIGVALLAVERALRLTKNLKYFAEQTALSIEPVDFSETVLEVSEWLENKLETRNINLKTVAESPMVIMIDEDALRHVLLNLLELACASQEDGQIALSLKKIKSTIEVKIRYKEKEPLEFYSETDAIRLSRNHSFTDPISLMVCNTIIESHGGLINFKKENGERIITIELPFDGKNREVAKYHPKRRFKRVKVDLPAQIELNGYPLVRTTICTLSQGGAFMLFPPLKNHDYPKRDDLGKLVIHYFDNQTLGISKLRVSSSCEVGPLPGIGVEFLELSTKSKKIISSLVNGYFP